MLKYLFIISCLFALSCNKPREIVTSINLDVCKHFNCGDATVLQVTDQYFPSTHKYVKNDSRKFSAAYAEFLAFQYNIPLHVFEKEVKGKEFSNFLKTGRGGASIYYPSCHEPFSKAILDDMISEISDAYGRKPTTLSYGCGKTSYKDSLPNYILGARNSSAFSIKTKGNPSVNYELSVDNIKNQPSSGRYYSDIQRHRVSKLEASTYVTNQVENAVLKSGYYMNFMHWHDYYKNKNDSLIQGVEVMDSLFIALNKGIGSKNNSKADFNEITEYLYMKDAIEKASIDMYDNQTFEISVVYNTKRSIDYNVISTPISFLISKKKWHSIFPNKKIENTGAIQVKEKGEDYIISAKVIFDENTTTSTIPFELGEKTQIQKAFKKPELSIQNNVIAASIPSKFVLFRRPITGKEYEIEVVDRHYKLSNSYKLPKIDTLYTYFCGAINENRESSLLKIN